MNWLQCSLGVSLFWDLGTMYCFIWLQILIETQQWVDLLIRGPGNTKWSPEVFSGWNCISYLWGFTIGSLVSSKSSKMAGLNYPSACAWTGDLSRVHSYLSSVLGIGSKSNRCQLVIVYLSLYLKLQQFWSIKFGKSSFKWNTRV